MGPSSLSCILLDRTFVDCGGRVLHVQCWASVTPALNHWKCSGKDSISIAIINDCDYHEPWIDALEAVPHSFVQGTWYAQLNWCVPIIVCSSCCSASPEFWRRCPTHCRERHGRCCRAGSQYVRAWWPSSFAGCDGDLGERFLSDALPQEQEANHDLGEEMVGNAQAADG